MNHWQPMINRCNAMDLRINEILTRRAAIATAHDNLVLYTIDDLETVLFAVRWAANSLVGGKDLGALCDTVKDVRKQDQQVKAK